jgi:hypothetical protein
MFHKDAWDTEAVFSNLKRLIALGSKAKADVVVSPISAFLHYFWFGGSPASKSPGRLHVLRCGQCGIRPHHYHRQRTNVRGGRQGRLAYHAGIACMQLRRCLTRRLRRFA